MQKRTVLYIENQAAISVAQNVASNRRNEHIDVRFNFSGKVLEDCALELRNCQKRRYLLTCLTRRFDGLNFSSLFTELACSYLCLLTRSDQRECGSEVGPQAWGSIFGRLELI